MAAAHPASRVCIQRPPGQAPRSPRAHTHTRAPARPRAAPLPLCAARTWPHDATDSCGALHNSSLVLHVCKRPAFHACKHPIATRAPARTISLGELAGPQVAARALQHAGFGRPSCSFSPSHSRDLTSYLALSFSSSISLPLCASLKAPGTFSCARRCSCCTEAIAATCTGAHRRLETECAP